MSVENRDIWREIVQSWEEKETEALGVTTANKMATTPETVTMRELREETTEETTEEDTKEETREASDATTARNSVTLQETAKTESKELSATTVEVKVTSQETVLLQIELN